MIIVLWTLLILLISSFSFLLFAPVVFELDTDQLVLSIRFHQLAVFRLHYINDEWKLYFRILFWKLDLQKLMLKASRTAEKKKVRKQVNKFKTRKREVISLKRIKQILFSFKITSWKVNIDTGDAPLNGKLFPLFWGLSFISGREWRINFTGEQCVKIRIENNAARILWAFIKPIK